MQTPFLLDTCTLPQGCSEDLSFFLPDPQWFGSAAGHIQSSGVSNKIRYSA